MAPPGWSVVKRPLEVDEGVWADRGVVGVDVIPVIGWGERRR